MAIFNFLLLQAIDLFPLKIIKTIIFSTVMLSISSQMSMAQIDNQSTQTNQTITGLSGGSIDSQGCGFIATNPNHQMRLDQRIDYIRLTVQADGGQPTLLVLGPNSGDSFCVLGDEISGLKPEISGVWEAGNYEIYIGDRLRERHQFVLDISVDN